MTRDDPVPRKTGNCVPRLLNIMFGDSMIDKTMLSELQCSRSQLDAGLLGAKSGYWEEVRNMFVDSNYRTGGEGALCAGHPPSLLFSVSSSLKARVCMRGTSPNFVIQGYLLRILTSFSSTSILMLSRNNILLLNFGNFTTRLGAATARRWTTSTSRAHMTLSTNLRGKEKNGGWTSASPCSCEKEKSRGATSERPTFATCEDGCS